MWNGSLARTDATFQANEPITGNQSVIPAKDVATRIGKAVAADLDVRHSETSTGGAVVEISGGGQVFATYTQI